MIAIPEATTNRRTSLRSFVIAANKSKAKIVCKGEDDIQLKKSRNVESLLKKFIRWEKGYGDSKCMVTYYEDGDDQSYDGAFRSLGDMYLLCKNYFPKTTINEVIAAIMNLREKHGIGTNMCGMIRKRVWGTNTTQDTRAKDEFGLTLADYSKIQNEVNNKKLQAKGKRTGSGRAPELKRSYRSSLRQHENTEK